MSDAGEIDYEKCKVADLKRLLKERGMSCAGNKSELISRLQAYEASAENGAEVGADEDELLEGEDEEHVEEVGEEEEEEEVAEAKEESEDVPVAEADEAGEAGEAAPAKVIKLNRPVIAEDTPPVPKPSTNETTEETTGMLAKRAERFGIQSEDAKKLARAQRFGISATNGKTSAKIGGSAPSSTEELEKLKKRAERFGTVVSAPLTKVAEQERLLKRKERFGNVTSTTSSSSSSSTDSKEAEEKKRRRLERFGNVK